MAKLTKEATQMLMLDILMDSFRHNGYSESLQKTLDSRMKKTEDDGKLDWFIENANEIAENGDMFKYFLIGRDQDEQASD